MSEENKFGLEHKANLEEFRALREEQMYSLRYRVWGIAVYAVISAGLFSYASDSEKNLACLAVIFIAVPFMYYTSYIVRNSVRIGAYIYAMENDIPGLSWEHALSEWRPDVKDREWEERKLGRWLFILIIFGTYDIISLCSYYLIFLSNGKYWQFILGFIGILLIVRSHFHLGRILDFKRTEDKYREFFSGFRKRGRKSDISR